MTLIDQTPGQGAVTSSPRRTPAPGRAGCRRGLGRVVVSVLAVAATLSPGTAWAAPGEPTSAAEAADQVAQRGHELEALTEQFNEAREVLAAQQAAAGRAVADHEQAQQQLQALDAQLSGVARAAYTSPGLDPLRALMASGSASEFLDRVATLDTIAGYHADVIARVRSAQAAAEGSRVAAEQAAAEALRQLGAVGEQQGELEAQIAAFQAQYATLTVVQQDQADVAHGGVTVEAPAAGSVVADSEAVQLVVDTAMAQLGDPYAWAAAGPDAFDCSGLTQYAFAAAGVSLPHSSRMQAEMGTPVDRADLQPGDLVYYYEPVSHIGIYLGGGRMVHASTSGEPVRVGSVDMAGYGGARRIVA